MLSVISQHVLRASVVAPGRAIVIYEEVNPTKVYGAASIHRKFMDVLRTMLRRGLSRQLVQCAQWCMGLEASQTRQPKRLIVLLLIAAFLGFALRLIELAARKMGDRGQDGSRKNAPNTQSILALARHWIRDTKSKLLSRRQLDEALVELISMLAVHKI